MTGKASLEVGNSALAWVGWGKLNRKLQLSDDFFFRLPKSPTAIKTCLKEMEEFSGCPKNLIYDTLSEVNFEGNAICIEKKTRKTHERIIPALSQLIIQQ